MCFPIYRSSLDQKYSTQRVQNYTCLINVHAWGRRALRDSSPNGCEASYRRRLKPRENELKLIMTPIKSLATIKRSLEKVFMCKSYVMIMIHFECFSHVFAMGRASHLFFGGGGGGVSKRKTKSCTRKEGEKNWYSRKDGKTFTQVSPIFGICITGMLERKFSYF